ncbi:MAG: TetR/AcrR family transcriptional regulator [Alkalispirochaetaceae bacterium]
MSTAVESETSRRDQILAAAFRAWGREFFANTSLSVVAEELGLSKAALYRHFRNKAEIIEAMEERYIADFSLYVLRPLEERREKNLRPFLRRYFSLLMGFFCDAPEYYVFFTVHVLKDSVLAKRAFQGLLARYQLLLEERIWSLGGREDTSAAQQYVTRFGVFWLTDFYRGFRADEMGWDSFVRSAVPRAPEERERIVEAACEVVLRGFLPDRRLPEERMARLEELCWVGPQEMLEPDRIFTAIEEVVDREGFSGATVEKIAEAIGMSKSSLYFYFRNKDEMFGKVVEREKAHFASLVTGRIRFIESVEQRLYALFLVAASYAVNNPTMVTVLNWLRYRSVPVRPPESAMARMREGLSFIEESCRRGEMRAPLGSPDSLIVFPNFLVHREMMESGFRELPREQQMRSLRRLYTLFERGIAPGDGEMKEQDGSDER